MPVRSLPPSSYLDVPSEVLARPTAVNGESPPIWVMISDRESRVWNDTCGAFGQ